MVLSILRKTAAGKGRPPLFHYKRLIQPWRMALYVALLPVMAWAWAFYWRLDWSDPPEAWRLRVLLLSAIGYGMILVGGLLLMALWIRRANTAKETLWRVSWWTILGAVHHAVVSPMISLVTLGLLIFYSPDRVLASVGIGLLILECVIMFEVFKGDGLLNRGRKLYRRIAQV